MTYEQVSVRFQNVNVVGTDPDQDAPVVVLRFCRVIMPAVKADFSVTISRKFLIPADIKRFCRERQEMLPVLFEKFGDHSSLFIMDFRCLFFMKAKELAIVFFDVMVRGDRNEQVPACRSHFVLYVSFFISGIRVAETDPETVVCPEPGKQVSFMDLVQGIATLMSVVTGVAYNTCIILAVIAFTLITVFSGAKGVLITDTIMFAVFSVATIIGAAFVASRAGGWMNTVTEMATYEPIPGILAAGGNPSYFYPTTHENMIWACGYGIAWMAVLAVAPWQSSRYLMAKNEHAVIRSSIIASVAVFVIEFLMCMAGVFTQKLNPGIEAPSHALIWASMSIMPAVLGIIVLSGVLASGISSATTFLSLISSNIMNDIVTVKNERRKVLYGRIAVLIVGVIICLLCIYQPPQIFWITYLGATIVACSWLPVALASVWSKRVTKTGAFWGMLVGFVVSAVMKIGVSIAGAILPIYLDPFFVGLTAGIIAMVIGSALTKVTKKEKKGRHCLLFPRARRIRMI